MPTWPNHDGSPTTPEDDFFPPPPEIGRVLSGTSNSRNGRVLTRPSLGLMMVIAGGLGGLPGLLVGWGVGKLLALRGPLATAVAAGFPAVGFLGVLILFLVLENQRTCTFVGEEGLATIVGRAGEKRSIFRFADAATLEIRDKDQGTNGALTGRIRECVWKDAAGRVVHREVGGLPQYPQELPPQALVHWLDAAVKAWTEFQARRG